MIVALTVTVPAAVAFKVLPLMVAPVVPALRTLHVIVLFVALAGVTVPVSVSGVPAVAVAGTPAMFVTCIKESMTVTAQVAVLLPSAVETVIVVVPARMGLTTPPLTVATAVLLLLQVRFLFEAFAGVTVAVMVLAEPPTFILRVVGESDTPVTETLPPSLLPLSQATKIKA